MFIPEFLKIAVDEIKKGNITFSFDLYISILILSIAYLFLKDKYDIENRIKKLLKL
jgi:hypothetical protein